MCQNQSNRRYTRAPLSAMGVQAIGGIGPEPRNRKSLPEKLNCPWHTVQSVSARILASGGSPTRPTGHYWKKLRPRLSVAELLHFQRSAIHARQALAERQAPCTRNLKMKGRSPSPLPCCLGDQVSCQRRLIEAESCLPRDEAAHTGRHGPILNGRDKCKSQDLVKILTKSTTTQRP